MGMFDYVKFKALCYQCSNKLTGWQTKDSDQMLETLELHDHPEIDRFYITCPKCKAWNEYKTVRQIVAVERVINEEEKPQPIYINEK